MAIKKDAKAKYRSGADQTPAGKGGAQAKVVRRSMSARELADLVLPGGPSEKY
jgi:hypothetical protein